MSYLAILSATFVGWLRVDASCKWNGEAADSGVTDWDAQCAAMDEIECGSHAFNRGHDAARCVWTEDIVEESTDLQPAEVDYGCIWDGSGAGDADRMSMACDRLTEAECRAAEQGSKDARCRWRARVHMGWNPGALTQSAGAVNVVEAVSRWVDENPHQILPDGEHRDTPPTEELPEGAEHDDIGTDSDGADGLHGLEGVGEVGQIDQDYSARFDHPRPPSPEEPAVEAPEPEPEPAEEESAAAPPDDFPYGLPGYQQAMGSPQGPQSEQNDAAQSVGGDDVEALDYSARFDHPRPPSPEEPAEEEPADGVDHFPFDLPANQQPVGSPQDNAQSEQPESVQSGHGDKFGAFDPLKAAPAVPPQEAGGEQPAASHFDHPMDGSSPLIRLSPPSVDVVADANKVGVCVWNGLGCNTGDGVNGVFMGCDSSKMISRCAKLGGAACEGDQGELYRCYWDRGGEREAAPKGERTEAERLEMEMDSAVLAVADLEVTAGDVLLAVTVLLTMAVAGYQLYSWCDGKKEVAADRMPERQPLILDLMGNRV